MQDLKGHSGGWGIPALVCDPETSSLTGVCSTRGPRWGPDSGHALRCGVWALRLTCLADEDLHGSTGRALTNDVIGRHEDFIAPVPLQICKGEMGSACPGLSPFLRATLRRHMPSEEMWGKERGGKERHL